MAASKMQYRYQLELFTMDQLGLDGGDGILLEGRRIIQVMGEDGGVLTVLTEAAEVPE